MAIKLIKASTAGGEAIHFNPEHVTHLRPVSADVSEITFVHGEKVEITLRDDDLAGRLTR